ncbi:MAG TPA: heme-binding protein [Burkholderiales bacterium]|nr:heme-binding protein [Burkholderiales bacterium]
MPRRGLTLVALPLLACALGPGASAARAQEAATFSVKMLTPETALKAAQAALIKCRDDGYQVAVAVVDRSGITQVMLRDRFAGAHTLRMAADKAWTAVSFRTATADLERVTQPGMPQSGIRHRPRVAAVAGGLMIEGGGALLGGIGISGAPGGDRDEACAKAGIAAIQDNIEF